MIIEIIIMARICLLKMMAKIVYISSKKLKSSRMRIGGLEEGKRLVGAH